MTGSRRVTRAQQRRTGVQNLIPTGSGSRPIECKLQELQPLEGLHETAHMPEEEPPPAEPLVYPSCSSKSSNKDAVSCQEAPMMTQSKGNASSACSSSVNQHDAPTSVSQQQPLRVMRCYPPHRTRRSPSPAADNLLNVQPDLPVRVMRCPVRPVRVMRVERSSVSRSNPASSASCDSAPSCSSSPLNNSMAMKFSLSPLDGGSLEIPSSQVSSDMSNLLESDSALSSKETASSKDSDHCDGETPLPVLKCRSGLASYPLRALKTVPFYSESSCFAESKVEPKKHVKKRVVKTTSVSNHEVCSPFAENESSHINQLPDEILCMIFSYLSHLELLRNCSKVCHRWLNLVRCPSLRRSLTFRGQDIPLDVVHRLIRFSPLLKSITIKDRHDVGFILPTLHQQCKRLETVNLVRCRAAETSQRNLPAKSLYPLLRKSQLRNLNLKGTDYKSKKFYQMLGGMPNLRKLDISCSKSVSPQILCEIARHTFLRVFKNKWHSHSIYHGPKSMTIQLPGKIDDWAFAYNQLFQNVGKNLTTLEFYAAGINDAALSGLASCTKLKKLCVYNANLFGAESMSAVSSLTELRELLIHNAKLLSTDNVVSALQSGNFSDLQCLHLNDSVSATGANVTADGCLEVVAAKCEKLQHFSFTECPDVTDVGVMAVLTKCLQLLSLDVNGGNGIAGECLLCIPSSTPHLKLLIVSEDFSKRKFDELSSLVEKHGVSFQTLSTWKHRTKSYYL